MFDKLTQRESGSLQGKPLRRTRHLQLIRTRELPWLKLDKGSLERQPTVPSHSTPELGTLGNLEKPKEHQRIPSNSLDDREKQFLKSKMDLILIQGYLPANSANTCRTANTSKKISGQGGFWACCHSVLTCECWPLTLQGQTLLGRYTGLLARRVTLPDPRCVAQGKTSWI